MIGRDFRWSVARVLVRSLAAALGLFTFFASTASAQDSLNPDFSCSRQILEQRATLCGTPADSALFSTIESELEARAWLPGIPFEIPAGVQIELAATPEEFSALAGGIPPEWSAGLAIPSQSRIILPLFGAGGADRRQLTTRILRHEWAHVGLHQYLEGRRVPRWFSEGYAQWAAGWNRQSAWRLRLLVAAGRTPPLDSLDLRFPDDAASAEVAYLLSATMIEYLVDASGEDALGLFLARWREEGRFEVALARTYGLTPSRLETAWRRWLKDRYGWIYIMGSSGIGWGILAALLLLLYRIRRRRDREGMARLRARDLPTTIPYWLDPVGPPTFPDGISREAFTFVRPADPQPRDPNE